MKTRLPALRPAVGAMPAPACSLRVLAGLGLLAALLPPPASAQAPGAGTLPVLRGVVSGRAIVTSPVPGAAAPRLTIEQRGQRAIIDWQSFNIGRDAEVLFIQPGSTASALNRIYDANPTVIQGRLSSTGPVVDGKSTPGGQILLINQNGILFDRGTQVNVQSLVASTLNLSNERFRSGALTAGGLTTPAFEGGYDETGTTLPTRPDGSQPAAIRIGRGGPAGAAAPLLNAGQGGSLLLFAPQIDNRSGILRAPDGQVLLAAGSKAYLALNDDAADITLRGFRVEIEADPVGAGLDLGSFIHNAGQISADRGNVTLAALAVNQQGRISAKTALQANGSIFLSAGNRDGTQAGSVTLGAGSVTAVLPDTGDRSTMPDSQDYRPFRGAIQISGGLIASEGRVEAPGGRILLRAENETDPGAARVYLGSGSQTSVAGTWADVDFEKNIESFRVTSNELKNAPDQKDGVLRGATVTVDLRRDSAILDLSGYRGAVARTVAEKAAEGGELQIISDGSVIQRLGAELDASGGGYRHSAGTATTTQLLGRDGRVYDIATAPQERSYAALLDRYVRVDPRWGQTTDVANPLGMVGTFQEAYVEGRAGGAIGISAGAGLVLDGTLSGGVTVGPPQTGTAPQGATLRIGEYLSGARTFAESQRIGNTTWRQSAFDSLGAGFDASTLLLPEEADRFFIAADQVFGPADMPPGSRIEQAFGSVELNVNGRLVVPSDVKIDGEVGTALVMRSPQIDVAGDIRLPSGRLVLQPVQPSTAPISPDLAEPAERLVVRSTATLSTAGAVVDRTVVTAGTPGTEVRGRRLSDGTTVAAIDGGTLSLQIDIPSFQTLLERGAVLDVGGGAEIGADRRVTGGRGGRLSIANGSTAQLTSDWLQADLRGFATERGGELTLSLARAVIDEDDANGVLPAGTTRLGAGLFDEQGFSRITVNASDGISVAAEAAVDVRQRNLVVDADAAVALPPGASLEQAATIALRPQWQRQAASLSLNARGGGTPGEATLEIGAGASVRTDVRGEIALSAVDGLAVDGRLEAPGGRLSLALNRPLSAAPADLRIGAAADLSVAGRFVATPNDAGQVRGTVIDAGSISLDARNAGLVLEAGALLDVSGRARTVERASAGDGTAVERERLVGHAGTVTLRSQGVAQLDATFVGRSAGAAGAGGSFALESVRPDGLPELGPERRIIVAPNGPAGTAEEGFSDATVDIAALRSGGFDKLRLQSENRIVFRGESRLDFDRGIRLDAPLIELDPGARTSLEASTVSLGQSLGTRQLQFDGTTSVWNLAPGTPQPALPSLRGDGVLQVAAGQVDLYGSLTLSGTALLRVDSESDIRLVGRPVDFAGVAGGQPFSRQIGGLTTAGNVELIASQVYPATRSEFTVTVRDTEPSADSGIGYILLGGQAGGPASAPLSAGGKVVLNAPSIVQGGTLRAPLGEIVLEAAERLELAPDSLTSVSADGLTIPYGTTIAGAQWRYTDGAAPSTILDRVSGQGKRVTLSAPSIDVRPGASVDLRGGGDVQAVEFVPGNGGDRDVTLRENTFAVLPAGSPLVAPYDHHTQAQRDAGVGFALGNGRDAGLYDSITVGPGGPLPAGEYTLLPARYALLPGASLVELRTGAAFAALRPGDTTTLGTGETVVAGVRSARGTDVTDSGRIGVLVRPGATARRASDYNLSGAGFFADAAALERGAAPAAPWDAGALTVRDAGTLRLSGSFDTAAGKTADGSSGRQARIDIAGERIAIVDRVGDTGFDASTLQIEAGALARLDGSVLLGGTREQTDGGFRIDTQAQSIVVANTAGAEVRVPELVLSANESIDIRSGARLVARGGQASDGATLEAGASGALVRLSGSEQARLVRPNASQASGDLSIAAGATLVADKAILLDATRSTDSQGSLQVGGTGGGGSLSLSSVRVALGETDRALLPPTGLVLSNADLAGFASLDELVLRSYASVDLVGAARIGAAGLGRLSIDSPVLRAAATTGGAAPRAVLQARQIELTGTSPSPSGDVAAASTGRFEARAAQVVLGAGRKQIDGFGDVLISATDAVTLRDDGALTGAGRVRIETPLLQVDGGAKQEIVAGSAGAPAALTLSSPTGGGAASTPPSSPGLGGQLRLAGSTVAVNTTVRAASGRIDVIAGAGDIRLGERAELVAGAGPLDFRGNRVATAGGTVRLESDGAVSGAAGARIDVSGTDGGGRGGRLEVSADRLDLRGTLDGRGATAGAGGSSTLVLGSVPDFDGINDALNAGRFDDTRILRLRNGDLNVGADAIVDARNVGISVDRGALRIDGQIGSGSGAQAARIELQARDTVQLADGSRIAANGDRAGTAGGDVRITSTQGALRMDEGATVDLRAAPAGMAGSLVFGVSRDADDRLAPLDLAGTVLRGTGQARAAVSVEATRTYDATGTVGADQVAAWAADHGVFQAAVANVPELASLRDEQGVIGGLRPTGAVQVISGGDLRIDAPWDLTSAEWQGVAGRGTLTLRAAGDLTLTQAIGNGDTSLAAGDSWNLRLVAGADTAAADPLATAARGMPGTVRLEGANARLRTGTGRIDIAAAADLRLLDPGAAIYTVGRIGAADTDPNGNQRWAVDGGAISIAVGGDVVGAAPTGDLWINEWLRRPRQVRTDFEVLPATDWWAYRPRFQQGIGTLGGGDIELTAGGSVRDVALMLPTSGRTFRDADGARQVDVQGGGNLRLRAGDDIHGGAVLVGRGSADIRAGGDIGAARGVQVYLMGVSSGSVPEGARAELVAGGSVTLQSVANPTTLFVPEVAIDYDAEVLQLDPSLGFDGNFTTFFTYSANSAIQATAGSGDLRYAAVLHPTWRTLEPTTVVNSLRTDVPAAFPASVSLVAAEGDLIGPNRTNAVTTFPSVSARVALLAGGSLENVGLNVSDLDPSQVITPTTSAEFSGGFILGQVDGRVGLRARSGLPRIVERDAADGYRFDIQARDGGFRSTATSTSLSLPAESRLEVGTDIVGARLELQNLEAGDVSVVRANDGDFRAPQAVTIGGPGRLLLQAGRNIDLGDASAQGGTGTLGGLVAIGNSANPQLADPTSARLTLIAGVSGAVDLVALDRSYGKIVALNTASAQIIALYRQLETEPDQAIVGTARDIAALADRDPAYARFVALDKSAPQALAAYQKTLRDGTLPLGAGPEARAAAALYGLLNADIDLAKLQAAGSVAALAASPGGAAYAPYVALAERYPVLFSDYLQRRSKGARPEGFAPIVFSSALDDVLAQVVASEGISGGSIASFRTSIQTNSGSDIDLWAPGGGIVVGLTTPRADRTIGVLTNAGGSIRSVLSGDFDINQGKVITAQGGDILILSTRGSIDAGRGAKTSLATPPPIRRPVFDADGNQIGVQIIIPASTTGSGIQSLTSDPDGLGPLASPAPGSIFLFAPAGTIDAGEAGIRSSGNIVLNAQTVLNASNISASGSAAGVPQVQTGSLASALASSGTSTAGTAKAAEEAARSAADAARRDGAASAAVKPNILSVEVLGFGDKNCRETDKDCFAK